MKLNHTTRTSAFTFVEILIVIAIIGLIAAIAIPNFVKGRKFTQKNACIANLKQIDDAKAAFAKDKNLTNSAPVAAENLYGLRISTLKVTEEPHCPAGGLYDIGDIGKPARCSFGERLGHTNSPPSN